MDTIRYTVAFASGKGGVGKSTTTVNVALALAASGARVGVLDADIYGPSLGMMLGIAPDQRPQATADGGFEPVAAHGLMTMSMAYLTTAKTPLVWRGPMAAGALRQMLEKTAWGELDYLLIDLPPGTGDIQLTLTQALALTGAVVVTTPQNVALGDARRAIEMFAKVDVPVLGIVENMAFYQCPDCGHRDMIFGSAGGLRIAGEYGAPLLGSLPLTAQIREGCDKGRPTVVGEPESVAAECYRSIANALEPRLSEVSAQAGLPEFGSSDD